ncbi:MAG: winged helix-turn-helix transcriptional regulator [Bacilli bacterium]|nr:winged helix-turn-helix transcriptional regulator [Bacilli bacterium]
MKNNEETKPLGLEIRMVANSIKKYLDKYLSESTGIDLTGVEGMTIFFIFRNRDKKFTSKDVMTSFRISKATASQTLNGLVDKGYITMKNDLEDRRSKVIELTEVGKEMQKKFDDSLKIVRKKITKGINEEEEAAFRATLNKILSNVGEENI